MITLSEAHRQTGANRQLIGFLVRDRGIPYSRVGGAKILDQEAYGRLLQAIAEHRAGAGRAGPCPGFIALN